MDITIYLPDALGAEAKAAELPLSRMLRRAVEEELQRRHTMSETLGDDVQTYEVALEDGYTGRVTGKIIATGDDDVEVYLTDDQRVIAYDAAKLCWEVCEDPEEDLRRWLAPGGYPYAAAMGALGIKPVIDL